MDGTNYFSSCMRRKSVFLWNKGQNWAWECRTSFFMCFEDHIQALLVTFSPFRPNKYLKVPCNIIVNSNPGNCYSVAFTFRVLSDLQDLKVLYVKIWRMVIWSGRNKMSGSLVKLVSLRGKVSRILFPLFYLALLSRHSKLWFRLHCVKLLQTLQKWL